MKRVLVIILVFMTVMQALGAPPTPADPFELPGEFVPANPIDEHVLARLRRHRIEPARLCSDAVFIRRAYLDLIGTLPEAAAVREFLENKQPDKRARLIDELLERPEFGDYWALKWCDLLRVKSEFPINLWPNAVQAYHRWIRDSIAQNKPYDRFAYELLTSSGSNFRIPPVNFYRAIQGREPSAIAAAVALTFMGQRIEHWPPDRRRDLEALFSRVAFKATAEWKEEIVYLDPAAAEPLRTRLPDGTEVEIPPETDARRVFADWLTGRGNQHLARAAVNRIWYWLMGRGIIHEPDDIRPDNPPSNPELLEYLEQELIRTGFHLRHVYRLIANSRTYQQSCIPRGDDAAAEALFAFYPVRRLDAEVLIDALNAICGSSERYVSVIPEPYTFIPENQRSIALADGSITSPFLELFGRPARDTGLESERDNRPTDAQRLHLLNSSHIRNKIEDSERLRALVRMNRANSARLIRSLYLNILSRYPTPQEAAAAQEYLRGSGLSAREAALDLVWALVNTKEFLYRH